MKAPSTKQTLPTSPPGNSAAPFSEASAAANRWHEFSPCRQLLVSIRGKLRCRSRRRGKACATRPLSGAGAHWSFKGRRQWQMDTMNSRSAEERAYLDQLASQDESLISLLRFQKGVHGRITLRLSRAQARQLRECLTTRLAEIGFDENYSPNPQGHLLETLVDRFFLR